MSPATAAYRARYHRDHTPRRYSGPLHATAVIVLATTLIGALLYRFAPHATALDWSIVPLTVVIASFVEYWAHRVAMHRPLPGLRAVYERHSRRHHRFFVVDAMQFGSTDDYHAVLFPPVLLLFFAAIALVLGALVALVTGTEAGALFAATALAYYLGYEVLHFAYHMFGHPACPTWRWLGYLARHHRRHHEPRRMREGNFNLVLPLFDLAFGTMLEPGPAETAAPLAQSDKIAAQPLR